MPCAAWHCPQGRGPSAAARGARQPKIAVSESVSLRPPPYTHCRYVANMLKYIVHKEDTTSMFKSLECAPAQPSALGRPPLATRHSPK